MAAVQVVYNNSIAMRMRAERAALGTRQQLPSEAGGRIAESDKLQRDISRRHMIFMALGGSIGAGLLVGSGGALNTGGPLSLVLNFALVGLGVMCTMGSLGEMAGMFKPCLPRPRGRDR